MKNTLQKLIALLLVCSLFLSACSTLTTSTPGPLIPGLSQTLAAETLTAQQGGKPGAQSQALELSPQEGLPTFEFASTITPGPTETPVPQLTPFENSSKLGSAPQSVEKCVNAAEFVKDISVPDNTLMKSGERFIKTWQFKNSGTCTWTPDYELVFIYGDRMGGETPKPLGRSISPGQFVEVSVELVAPKDPGEYQGSWIFQDTEGNQFGTGYQARQFFWVAIAIAGKLDRFFRGGGCIGGG